MSLYLVDVLTVKEEAEGETTVTTDGFFSLNSGFSSLFSAFLSAHFQRFPALPLWV